MCIRDRLWGKNKFFAGSYSSAQPGKAHLRNSLKSSVAEKIFFAGEAISSNYATVHGADLSGKDTALKVIEVLKIPLLDISFVIVPLESTYASATSPVVHVKANILQLLSITDVVPFDAELPPQIHITPSSNPNPK